MTGWVCQKFDAFSRECISASLSYEIVIVNPVLHEKLRTMKVSVAHISLLASHIVLSKNNR